MLQWHFLGSQLVQRVSNVVYLWIKEFIERTSACEIARMRAMCASLNCSESESESKKNDTGEMHDVGNGYDNT